MRISPTIKTYKLWLEKHGIRQVDWKNVLICLFHMQGNWCKLYKSLCRWHTFCFEPRWNSKIVEKDFIIIIVQKNRFGIHMVDMPPFLCDDGNINVHFFLWLAQMFIDNQSQCLVHHHGWQDEPYALWWCQKGHFSICRLNLMHLSVC
jgi:hypothetical protein